MLADAVTFNSRLADFWKWDLDGSLFSSLFVMLILIVLSIVIFIKVKIGMKKKSYLEKPKGLLHLVEIYYNYIDTLTRDNMGDHNEGWGGYLFGLFAYLFLAFMWGATGFPSVVDWLAAPLCLSLVMFVIIQVTALKHQKFSYFHRYIEPFAIFLPINLITMWAPIISTTMRLFGNSISGFVLIGIIQWALGNAANALYTVIMSSPVELTSFILAPIVSGVLQLYFTLFSGAIQTLVFGSLNAAWIAAEIPEPVSPALNDTMRPEVASE